MIKSFYYYNLPIVYNEENNYINATTVAKHFGTQLSSWLDTNEATKLIFAVGYHESKRFVGDIKVKKDYIKDNDYLGLVYGDRNNRFIEIDLFKQFAYYCDPKFGVWFSNNFNEIFYEPIMLTSSVIEDKSEKEIAKDMKYIIDYCQDNNGINIETSFVNVCDDKTNTRRVDFIKEEEDRILIIELKKGNITHDIFLDTISRRYIQTVEHYYNKKAELLFLTLKEVDDKTKACIELMSSVNYTPLQSFMKEYYLSALTDKWKNNKKHINSIISSNEYSYLFEPGLVNNVS
jgi:hypothetical protein